MVRTRFAPSPTGYLHIGGVRTALFNWLFARHHQGQFVLRIDDTDQQRNVEAALQPILDGFRWLGIQWDEGPEVGGSRGPYFQSQRGDRHRAAVRALLESGTAYRDYARSEELQAQRAAAEADKRPFTYDRTWMAETDDQAARFEAEGRRAVVRLKMPREGSCRFHDLVRGDVEFQWGQEQDHVIQRADGSCLYHLASTVDDHDLQITHVIRAVEHLSNTPRQIFIARSLGYELPRYAHLPYVAEPGSPNKLSKRKINTYLKNPDFKKLFEHGTRIAELIGHETSAETFNPVLVDFYRTVGYLPHALLNYLLLLGWSFDDQTEQFSREEMVQRFSLDRVNKAAASFDPQKLWAFQQRDMLQLPLEEKVGMLRPYVVRAGWVSEPVTAETDELLGRIAMAAGDRIKTAGDVLDYDEFFREDDHLHYDEKAFNKRLRKGDAATLLKKFRDHLEALDGFDAPATEACLRQFIDQEGVKIGNVIHALRVAVTGKSVGLGMFDTLAILGRDRVLARIDRALALL
ncbi:MAG: glutamate--tRNA ligase [Planctomycetota bacterium]